jgi:hypothetical protein
MNDNDYNALRKNQYFDFPPIWLAILLAVIAVGAIAGLGELLHMALHAAGYI